MLILCISLSFPSHSVHTNACSVSHENLCFGLVYSVLWWLEGIQQHAANQRNGVASTPPRRGLLSVASVYMVQKHLTTLLPLLGCQNAVHITYTLTGIKQQQNIYLSDNCANSNSSNHKVMEFNTRNQLMLPSIYIF